MKTLFLKKKDLILGTLGILYITVVVYANGVRYGYW
jgi:hypothetical protein